MDRRICPDWLYRPGWNGVRMATVAAKASRKVSSSYIHVRLEGTPRSQNHWHRAHESQSAHWTDADCEPGPSKPPLAVRDKHDRVIGTLEIPTTEAPLAPSRPCGDLEYSHHATLAAKGKPSFTKAPRKSKPTLADVMTSDGYGTGNPSLGRHVPDARLLRIVP